MADLIRKMQEGHTVEDLDTVIDEVYEARGEYDSLGERLDDMEGGAPTPSTSIPAMDGTGSAGASSQYARADHVHPSDTSKQNALSSTQLDAVNSGIDSTKVAQIETNKNDISTCKEFTDNATIDSDRKLYINATEPTGYIPVGSTWINGSTIKEYTGGNNLFNQSDVRLIPANAAGALRCGTNVGVLPPGTYTFNAVKSASAVLLYLQKVVGDAYTVEDITSLPFSFTTTGVETVIVRTASATVKTWAEQGYTDIMLNFGTTAEMYEPYDRAWT